MFKQTEDYIKAKRKDIAALYKANPELPTFKKPAFTDPLVQERIMRLRLEIIQSGASDMEEWYQLAILTLEQDYIKHHHHYDSTTSLLFSKQETGEILYYIDNTTNEVMKCSRERLSSILSKFTHGTLPSYSAMPRLYR